MVIIYRSLAGEEDDFLLADPVETKWIEPVLAGIQGSATS